MVFLLTRITRSLGKGVVHKLSMLTRTLHLKSLLPLASVWSKTTLNTGGVGGAWVGPQTCEMVTFFLMSLALHKPILNNLK